MRNTLSILLLVLSLNVLAQTDINLFYPLNRSDIKSVNKVNITGSQSQELIISNALLLTNAIVNGTEGLYILDSGAPGLILNIAKSDSCQTQVEGFSLTGDINFGYREHLVLNFGPLLQENIIAYTLDLSYLEVSTGLEIAGILGYEQFKELILKFDLENNEIHFLAKSRKHKKSLSLPIHWQEHTPILRSKINGRKAWLAFDTGAGINLIAEKFYSSKINSTGTGKGEILLRGLDANTSIAPVKRIRLTELSSGNWHNLPYAVTDLSSFKEFGIKIDGVLGNPWMEHRKLILDYKRNRILIQQ